MSPPRLAIIAGQGDLPRLLFAEHPDALYVTIEGTGVYPPRDADHLDASFEKIGSLFRGMRSGNVGRVVLAGAIRRPNLNPARFDAKMLTLVPRLVPALGKGDDTLLRLVIDVFEREGFPIVGPQDAAPGLLAAEGLMAGPKVTKSLAADAERGRAILAALADQDVGQATVVAAGQCLGIETIQGTNALLRFVGQTDKALVRGLSVLVKRPKAGQDLRVDLPTIGPETIGSAALAGIRGIELAAGATLILHRDEVEKLVNRHAIALWGHP